MTVKLVQYKAGQFPQFELKSDLVNGLPRGFAGSLKEFALVATPPDPPDTSAIRDCLTCGRPFKSSGIGNRMCERCIDKTTGRYISDAQHRGGREK